MRKDMWKSVLAGVAFVGVIALGLATPAVAQDQGYYTYVSFWAVPRSQWATFEKQEQATEGTLQKLVADGTLVAWGAEAARVHTEEGYTHADWETAPSRAALLKALEALYSTAANPAFESATKHHDEFLHTLAHGGKTASGATGYIRVAFWKAKPGADEALEAHVMKYIKPVLDADVENGTLLMYNFDKEDIHTSEPGAYNLAMAFPNGESMDKFFTELAAHQKDNPVVGQVLESLTVAKAHRDGLGRVTAYQHK